jgi:hypothetical protein
MECYHVLLADLANEIIICWEVGLLIIKRA